MLLGAAYNCIVFIDGRGTGDRSREFRLRSQQNLKDGGGGPDHPAMLRQMAALHSSMDLDRVGIWGHSAVRHTPIAPHHSQLLATDSWSLLAPRCRAGTIQPGQSSTMRTSTSVQSAQQAATTTEWM